MKKVRTLLLLFTFITGNIFCVNKIDSLKALLKTIKGNEKINVLSSLGKFYLYVNNDSSISYSQKVIKLIQQNKEKELLKAEVWNYLGAAYTEKGAYTEALNCYLESMTVFKKSNNSNGLIQSIANIGVVYELQGIYDKAKEQYQSALSLAEKINDPTRQGEIYNHLGSLFYTKNEKEKALGYFNQALGKYKITNEKSRILECLNNIAVIYQETGKLNEALVHFKDYLAYAKLMNDNHDKITSYHNIGLVYKDQKDFFYAIKYLDSCIHLAKEIQDFEDLREAYSTLSEIYQEEHNYPKALHFFKLSTEAKDSLLQKAREEQFIEMSTKYETEKKETENKLLKSESEKHKTINIAVSIGLVLVGALAFFIFRGYKQQHKANALLAVQNKEIKEQKHIIEEKQTEILDSISYAKRLQDAIIPPKQMVNKFLPDNFILYRPKDIVAGDFYWMEAINDLVLIAAADCTGHGVPGAMVSIVCSNALNRTVKEFNQTEPGKILDKTRELVLETFSKSKGEVKDGMDISLLCINTKEKKVTWSGANNPLWYTQPLQGVDNQIHFQLKEITADKQPIGKTETEKPFTTHTIELIEKTTFYLFTDGFADQFGGPKGKKFKYKPFGELLTSTNHLSKQEQFAAIQSSFENWRGNLEQVDDVLLIGITI